MTPRWTPLHDTLQALAEDFAHAIVRAVCETSLRELAEARASLADATTSPLRSARPRRARAARPDREKAAQLELLDRAETYADVAIVDPAALLDGSRPAEDGVRRTIAPEEAPEVPPVPETTPVLDRSEATSEAADPSPASSPPERCWTVNVADGDQQEMAVEEIVGAYRAGIATDETFVWKDGMSDWLVIRDVPEIFRAVTNKSSLERP